MKQAVVFLRDRKAGVLTEDENGYTFQYDQGFLHSDDAEAISLTLPLNEKLMGGSPKKLLQTCESFVPPNHTPNIVCRYLSEHKTAACYL